MGDRAIIYVKESAAAVYLHWNGEEVLAFLLDAIPRMRCDDPDYSAARLIGEIHNRIDGNHALGILPPPNLVDGKPPSNYSHGDAGVVVYDCETGETRCFDGYLAEKHPKPQTIGPPPK